MKKILMFLLVAVPCISFSAPCAFDMGEAFRLVNNHRAQHGLGPVGFSSALTKAAKYHSNDMAQRDDMSHYGSNGSTFWQRIQQAGYQPNFGAENVAAGQRSLHAVFQAWKNSPGHNANMLSPNATEMGLALSCTGNSVYVTYWTMELGRPIAKLRKRTRVVANR